MFVSTYELAVYQAQSHCTFWSGFLFHTIQWASRLRSPALKPVCHLVLPALVSPLHWLLSHPHVAGVPRLSTLFTSENPKWERLKVWEHLLSTLHLRVSAQVDSSSELRKAARQGTGRGGGHRTHGEHHLTPCLQPQRESMEAHRTSGVLPEPTLQEGPQYSSKEHQHGVENAKSEHLCLGTVGLAKHLLSR